MNHTDEDGRTFRQLRLVEDLPDVPDTLSGHDARRMSKAISASGAEPISAARLQQLWAGAKMTKEERASIQIWTEHRKGDLQRIRDDVRALNDIIWRLLPIILGALVLGIAIMSIYLVKHASEITQVDLFVR
ncbi:hypothetical protein [Mycolicibacterium peregrinum]|uniref:hypothetical protein n=1 Tax=Mycolicibacterium peregrinum TaxID=43304 RepID=UPI003AB0052E